MALYLIKYTDKRAYRYGMGNLITILNPQLDIKKFKVFHVCLTFSQCLLHFSRFTLQQMIGMIVEVKTKSTTLKPEV